MDQRRIPSASGGNSRAGIDWFGAPATVGGAGGAKAPRRWRSLFASTAPSCHPNPARNELAGEVHAPRSLANKDTHGPSGVPVAAVPLRDTKPPGASATTTTTTSLVPPFAAQTLWRPFGQLRDGSREP